MYNTTRFIYNADAPAVSPAAAMAALSVEAPVETKTEVPAPTEAPAVAPIAESAKPVAETPKPEVPLVQEKPWQEVLKSQKPEAIFKELGLDDKAVKLAQRLAKADPKMAAFFDTWESKGDVKSYLEALSVDYSKMSPEDVIRQNLKSEFPDISKEDFADLYAVKVIDRYKQDPERFTEDEVRRGKIEMMADSKPVREALVKQQQERLLPPSPEAQADPRIAEFEQTQKRQTEAVDNYKKTLYEDPFIKNMVTNKQLTIGTGEEAFNYKLPEPEKVLSYLYDGAAVVPTLQTDGKDDPYKSALISAFAHDPAKFIQELGTHFKALGAKAFVDPIENPSVPGAQTSKPEVAPATAAEAMAKGGKWNNR